MTVAMARGRFELEDHVVPDVPEHRRVQEEARLKEIEKEMQKYRKSS
jgi:hypothetical protein